jgi:tetratricopeptide (TPR) repeat protein
MSRALLCVSALLYLSIVHAADKPERGPIPSWVQPTVLPTDNGTADDAAVKVLLTDWQFNFSASGAEAYFASAMRIQTSQGLAGVGTLAMPWNPATDVLTVHKLQIDRAGQTIDVLAGGQDFTVLRRENSLEYATLNGILTAVIQPAGLQVGDTVEVAFSIKRSIQVLSGSSEWLVGGWPNIPLAHVKVRGRWTAPVAIRWQASDSMSAVHETHAGDTTEVVATLDNMAPLAFPKGAPARYARSRWIEFSSFKSWAEISARLAPLYAQAATLTPESPLKNEISSIRSATTDKSSRAMAALALVQDKVRYVFLGMNDGALVPASAELTWSRRFGDCKGKTALLLALLHGLDIDAEPVAVNTTNGDSIEAGLPLVEAFNHVLVRAVIDGKTYWLDGAASGDRRLDDLIVPPYYWGLPLEAQGAELARIVPTPLRQPTAETNIHIDASGGTAGPVPIHAEAVFRGPFASVMRLGLGNLSAVDREQALRQFWSKALASAKVAGVAAKFDEQTAQERLTFDGSTVIEWTGGHYELEGLMLVYPTDFTRTDGPEREAPFLLNYPAYGRVVETIKLPQTKTAFKVEGDDINRTIAGAEFRRRVHIEQGVLTGETSIRTLEPQIPYATAQEAKGALREVTTSSVYLRAPAGYVQAEEKSGPVVAAAPAVMPPAVVPLAPTPPAAVSDVAGLSLSQLFDPQALNRLLAAGNRDLDRREYDQAIAEFDRVLQVNPKSDLALADRGMAYMWKDERERALEDFAAAEALDPRNHVVPRGRGMLALFTGNAPEAIADFNTALELDAGNQFALIHRAEAYRLAGDLDKAMADANEVIRLNPAILNEYAFRASLRRQLGELEAALQEGDAVVAANPTNPAAYVIAASISRTSGQDAAALTFLDRSLASAPTAQAYLTKASYRPRSDLAGRRADINTALALDARSLSGRIALASVQSDDKDYTGAVATLDQAMSIDGETAELLAWRGVNYSKNGQSELAAKDFAAARVKATDALTLNNICWNIATAGVALDVALSACDASLALHPTAAAALDSRGFVLLRLGRYDAAIAAYDASLQARPRASMSLYGRGMAKRLKGDKAAGDSDFKAALRVDAHVATAFADLGVKP